MALSYTRLNEQSTLLTNNGRCHMDVVGFVDDDGDGDDDDYAAAVAYGKV